MYELLESKNAVSEAQETLEATIRTGSSQTIARAITWNGGSFPNENLSVFNGIWFFSRNSRVRPNEGRLNWFGEVGQGQNVHITVEINTPYEGKNGMLAGFFARDTDTGLVYLLHSGRLGGGRKGMSKEAFIKKQSHRTVTVHGTNGYLREGIVVMPIEGRGATDSAAIYVKSVARFKDEATKPGDKP